jgi:signal transduction histidine kinase/CheY-like chemotaxis protein/PAS domain-containing protein
MEIADSLLKSLAENNPGNFALYRLHEGRLLTLFRSPLLPALSGMNAEDYDKLTESDAATIVFPEDRLHVQEAVAAAFQTHQDVDLTYRIAHASTGAVWIHACSRFIGEREGDPILYTIFQATSGESKELATILSNSMTQVYVLDAHNHELLFANAPALRSWGADRYAGEKCHRAVCHLDGPCPWCPIPKMVNGSFHEHEFYSPIDQKWYDLNVHAMDWHGRDAIAFYRQDITPEKEGQTRAELDKETLETTVNHLRVGVAACEIQNGQILTAAVNDRLKDLLGVDEKDFVNSVFGILGRINPLDRSRAEEAMKRIRDGEEEVSFEFRYCKAPQFRETWLHCESSCLLQNARKFVFLSVSDYTEQKEAELEALRRKTIYEAAVEETHLCAWEYYPKEKRIVAADNPTTKANPLVGIVLEKENEFPEILYPSVREDSLDDFKEIFREIDRGKPMVSADIWFKAGPKVAEHCERISYTCIFGEDGQVVKAVGIEQDVTNEKMAEKKYEQAFTELEESRPNTLGSFRMDINENRVLESRSNNKNILLMSKDGTVDELFESFAAMHSDPEDTATIRSQLTRQGLIEAFATGRSKFGFVSHFRFADGSFHWLENSLYLIENPKNNHLEALAFAYIVDERKKMEDVVAHLTSKHFDYIAILHLNEATIEFVTKAPFIPFETGTPLAYESWRNHLRNNAVLPAAVPAYNDESDLEKIRQGLQERGEYTFVSYQKIDGKKTYRQSQYSWLDEKGGDALVLRSDITHTYEEEQSQLRLLKEALKNAEEANEGKSEFLSRISHDIRTPISIIKSMTAFAFEDIDKKEKLQDDLRKIEASNTFLLSLINDVLDISKIDAGKIELHPEPYLYGDYISNISNMAEPLCAAKKIKFVFRQDPGLSSIMVDHIRLNQISLNLLSNAVKYTPEGGRVTFASGADKIPDKPGFALCHIEVSDTGIGMSEEFQKKMFQPFTQEYDNPDRPKASSGTGLGLAIVKRIVDLLGGSISVHSAWGKGTTMRIVFPAQLYDADQRVSSVSPLIKNDEKLSGKVLLCEDNEINAAIAKRLLSVFGVGVDLAVNGEEGTKLFRASKPGEYFAILMDIQMPILNGYEATERIRSYHRPDAKTIPIIAMTADAFSAALEKSKEAGMSDYLTKPLDPEKIRQALLKAKHQ